jgi:exosortase K
MFERLYYVSMYLNRNWLILMPAFILFGLLKLAYTQATPTHLLWLLWPTNAMVGVVLNSTSQFVPAHGFLHPALHIAIDKSCSGFNFWLLCSGLLLVSALRYPRAAASWWLLSLPVVAYGLTVLVNASRIITAVSLQRVMPAWVPELGWLHQAEGVLVYLSFLLLISAGFQRFCHFLSNPA